MAGEIVRRPDIEAMECSYPDYIGTKVLKWLPKPTIAGRVFFQPFHASVSAQYNRNQAALAEITDTVVASASETYSCAEVRSKIAMSYAERITGYASDEDADIYMGRLSKRAYMDKIELLVAGKLLNTTGAINGIADPVTAIDTNVALLRDAGIGRIALVTANKNKIALKSNQTIIERMKATGLGAYDLREIRGYGDENLAAALGVDEILTGKDAIWYSGVAGSAKDCVALVVLPSEEYEPTEEIQLGRVIYYTFSDSLDDRICCQSWVDAHRDANILETKGLVDVHEFNSALRKTIRIYNNNDDSSSSN